MYNRSLNPIHTLQSRVARNRAVKLPTQRNWRKRSGFGLNEVIGIAITVMVAALVIAPGIRTFSTTLIDDMTTWFGTISTKIFAVA
ncbi:MAG: hypothetical protein EOM08_01480 [Clostridia bacterium]|nr:hypothetical protein [Clostridia bacterium]NCC75087.1 hypothetical protein [Clostridia bacterium]